jgi:hypothetical protein
MLKYKNKKTIEVSDWDELVEKTYGRPYSFQQQEGCKSRGTFHITIPCKYTEDEEMNDSIPEEINGDDMGVKFKVWLERDPNAPFSDGTKNICLFWERNFYPDVHTVANDLFEKGLIEAGDYVIDIDW